MTVLIVYEFLWMHIGLLYLSLLLASLGSIVQVKMLLHDAEKYQTKLAHRRMHFIVNLHLFFFIVLLILSYPESTGARCTSKWIYPICFYVLLYGQLCFFITISVFMKNAFWVTHNIEITFDNQPLLEPQFRQLPRFQKEKSRE